MSVDCGVELFGLLCTARGATNPIGWPAAVVRYRQDEYAFALSRVNERIAELSQRSLANTRSNLFGRLRELRDQLFGPLNLGQKTSPEAAGAKLEISDLAQQLFLGRLMVSDRNHRRRVSAF